MPLNEIVEKLSAAAPVFFTVTGLVVELMVLTVVAGKVNVVGVTVIVDEVVGHAFTRL